MTVTILQGDVRAVLPTLAPDSFDCIVTSPPYWGLRDYGVAGQIGLEATLDAYLDTMVAVCRDLRRVLKPSGTFWLNIGDSYAGSWGAQSREHAGKHAPNVSALSANQVKAAQMRTGTGSRARTPGLKPKDLCMVPNRLAIRLQEDGWWVRSEIVWAKPNPMPESVTDRPTSAHEKVWLLTKSERYFFDAEAVREMAVGFTAHDLTGSGYRAPGQPPQTGNRKPGAGSRQRGQGRDKQRGHSKRHEGFNERWDALTKEEQSKGGRNIRNVWTLATKPFAEAHFATFPPELAELCIKAGCPGGGHMLDPFGGAGTTGLVADRLQRDSTLIELNPAYVEIARKRITADARLFAEVAAE